MHPRPSERGGGDPFADLGRAIELLTGRQATREERQRFKRYLDLLLVWNRVHRLPDYVHFNHSIHVATGIGCASCHGRIDKMNLVYQASPLTMDWCVSCHRAPEKFVREPSDPDRWVADPGAPPVLAPDGDPDLRWHLIGKAVESQGRREADDPLGHKPSRFSQ